METNTNLYEKKSEIMPSDKGLLRISKVVFGQWKELHLDKSVPWIDTILSEICDHYEIGHDHKGNCSVKLKVLRKKSYEFGDQLIVDGNIDLSYDAQCIRCLEAFNEHLNSEINLIIVDESVAKKEEYQDVDEVYAEEKNRELYSYERGQLNLKELVRELCFLELNPLPLHDAECKGLCFECGADLNYEQCSHSQS
ncbi:MAG: YceD family protein [Bacteriovoracaceae bacterium]